MTDNKQPITLVIAITNFKIGGVQSVIVDHLKYFSQRNYKLYLLTFFQYPEAKNFYGSVPEGVEIVSLNFRSFRDIKSWIQTFKALRAIRPDVVLSNLFFSNTVLRLLKLFFGYRIIAVENSPYIDKTRWQKLMDRFLSGLTYKIATVSDYVSNYTSKQEGIKLSKFQRIYNGIDLREVEEIKNSFDRRVLKKELGFQNSDRLIINVGRLAWVKQQDLLIKAFGEFVKTAPNYKLLIIGEGPWRKRLEKMIAELNLHDKVLLLGGKPKKDVYKHYYISDFFVITSHLEGFAISAIEAMAFGLAVLSTDSAGPGEYLREGVNGKIVSENTTQLAEGMKYFAGLDESSMSKYRQNSLQVSAQFDSRDSVVQYENLILASLK